MRYSTGEDSIRFINSGGVRKWRDRVSGTVRTFCAMALPESSPDVGLGAVAQADMSSRTAPQRERLRDMAPPLQN